MWDVNVFFFKEPIVGINALTILLGLFHFLFYNWLTIGLDIPDVLVALDKVMGQFDTADNLTPRTIWHFGQFDTIMASRTIWHHEGKEDNLTPRTIWHLGQFDTIMQNRTIWHRPCREDNLTPRTIWHRGQFDTIINFIFLQLFGPQIWLEIYWLPLSIFLTENYPV